MLSHKIIVSFFVAATLAVGVFLLATFAAGDSDNDTVASAGIRFYQHGGGAGADGYDVVAYFNDSRAMRGKVVYEETFAGEAWRFVSLENLRQFRDDPEKYLPKYGGHCAYGVAQNYLVRGDPAAWSIRDGVLYFNYNKNIRNAWLANADSFIARGEKNWRGLNK